MNKSVKQTKNGRRNERIKGWVKFGGLQTSAELKGVIASSGGDNA